MRRPSSSNPARADIAGIINAALAAVDPAGAVRRVVHREGDRIVVAGVPHRTNGVSTIQVIGAGKGSASMAEGLEEAIGDLIAGGHVTVKDGHGCPLSRISIGEASHPVPDHRGELEAQEALRRASVATDRDLVICLISGGGSALWPAPVPGLDLTDKKEVTRLLLACGASIDEINAVRKHLSLIKGGQLARAAHPASLICLMISDVPGDRLDVIASGPTCPDPSTFSDAIGILGKYGLEGGMPKPALTYLTEGAKGGHPETPKPGDETFRRVQNVIIANNRMALDAASAMAGKLGFLVHCDGEVQTGGTEALGERICEQLAARQTGADLQKTCFIWGGETTMVLPGDCGLGGRNQHLALCVAERIQGLNGVTFASVGTDGTDGPTDAAGGIVDGGTFERMEGVGISGAVALRRCDSYHALKASGDLLMTGPTRTNVMDIQILLLDPARR